ncbi:MAG: FtsX-like permease family protein [Phycisphaerae bacterium]|nr:FtsX-like permease family protein [Phycisphaerae bacterium]
MYKLKLIVRYLYKRPVCITAALAVALCVFIVIVVMSVMDGLVSDFKQNNHNYVGDCVVGTESLVGFGYYEEFMEKLSGQDFVTAVSPVIKSYGLITPAGTNRNIGVEIMGIDAAAHSRVTNFGQTLTFRKNNPELAFAPAYDTSLTGCVMGIDLMVDRDPGGEYLRQLTPFEFEFVISCFPLTAKGAFARAGTETISSKSFYYSDVSHTGLARIDGATVYIDIKNAQAMAMAGEKRVNALFIKFTDDIRLEAGCSKVRELWESYSEDKIGLPDGFLLSGVTVQSWKQYRRSTIAAMEKEQVVMTILFYFLAVVTVFIIFVVFYMIVSHKTKDVGILKSVGVSHVSIVGIFCGLAALIACLGSLLGEFAGWIFLNYINHIEGWLYDKFGFQLWDRTIYAIGEIPDKLTWQLAATVLASAILVCLAGAYFPARRAAKLKPVDALQVNPL